ncbi:MAG: hypothetical protein M0P13_03695 [Fibrobacteraceae bacterium]|nr:hypothetical protein [Fibrobacteraceae bacterium]
MRKLLFFLLVATLAYSADFERSNWHTQTYLQVEPYTPITFKGNGQYLNENIDETVNVVPVSLGFLFSPLFTPLFKADIPFTIFLGGEIGEFQMGKISSGEHYTFGEGSSAQDYTGDGQSLSFMSMNPAGLVGFSFNIAGNLDLRVLGGYGIRYYRFENEETSTTKIKTATEKTMFVSGAIEYKLFELFQDGDLKIGLNVRKEFKKFENVQATPKFNDDNNLSIPGAYSGVTFEEIKTKLPVRIALEISLEFGRESRRDRSMRFALRDRDAQLRSHSEVKDTLSDWDCMAIERDYRFFLEDGALPDMSEKYTKAQFNDVLESYLAFCHPEDLATKEQLYSSLDSNKVSLKEYQVSQEDSRFKQVMASNDVEMMEMYLQYYPNSPRRGEIQAKIKVIGDYHIFKKAQETNTFKSYLDYLNDFPEGQFRKEAEECIFALVKESNRAKDYEIYLKRFPDGQFISEARHALQELQRSTGISATQSMEQNQEEVTEQPVKTKSKKTKTSKKKKQ